MNKLYSVHDHWTDINKKNDVDIESIDGVITGIKVNGEDYGGSTWTEVFSGDVVTSGEAAPFSGTINANLSGSDTIMVFYNDGKYILPKQVTDDGIFYGATPGANPGDIDFSEYPFLIRLGEGNTALYTQAPGPQNITILEPQSGGSSDFSTAEVTINASQSFEFTWDSCPMLLDGVLTGSLYVGSLPATITVPLYNGKCVWDHNTMGLTLSGNIEKLYEGEAMLITGDCTITITIS